MTMRTAFTLLSALFFSLPCAAQDAATASVDSHTVALWHFDEGTGTILHDASTYHNDGSIHNAAWVGGRFGSGLHFDGATSYVVLPNAPSLQLRGDFTIEAWISLDTLQFEYVPPPDFGAGVILSNLGPYPCGGGYGLAVRDAGAWFDYRSTGCESWIGKPTPIPSARHFYHVAAIYTRNGVGPDTMYVVKTYIDGTLADSSVFPGPIQYSSTPYFYIGTNRDGRAVGGPGIREFPGIIDEVRISDIALNPQEFGETKLVASRDALDFGLIRVGDTATLQITLANASFDSPLHIDTVSIRNQPSFGTDWPSADPGSFDLPPLSNQIVNITYHPIWAETDSGALIIYPSGQPPTTIHLKGKAFTINASPVISSVRDIPDDQGKQVRIIWYPSIFDGANDSLRVTEYSVWRRADGATSRPAAVFGSTQTVKERTSMLMNGELWDFVVSVPAVQFDRYAYVAPTLYNSTPFDFHWSVFKVAAHTATGEFFFSGPDSGSSFDNVFPPPPQSIATLVRGRSIVLTWERGDVPDVARYNLYRSTSPFIVTSPFSRLASTEFTTYADSTGHTDSTYYYLVTEVDSSGNEGLPSQRTGGVQLTGVGPQDGAVPESYSLGQNYPNPFNPNTTIEYGLPVRSRVQLRVYDVLGREAARLVDEVENAGLYKASWWPALGSGFYIYRLEVTGVEYPFATTRLSRKMLLLK